jgi:hypothetical protein
MEKIWGKATQKYHVNKYDNMSSMEQEIALEQNYKEQQIWENDLSRCISIQY